MTTEIEIKEEHRIPGRGQVLVTSPGPRPGEIVSSGNRSWEVLSVETSLTMLAYHQKPSDEVVLVVKERTHDP